ncbi:MAG: glucosyltransferase domain-containing protein [Treponema sp.]|nr:glucosyltransferase domain-containing protein [Treponema sp.]
MYTKLRKLCTFQTLLLLAFAFCLICILPFTRALLVALMEMLIGRSLRNIHKWDMVIIHSMAFFATLCAIWYFLWYTKKGKPAWSAIKEKYIHLFCQEHTVKYLTVLFTLLCIFFFALLRANYDYQDDITRSFKGHKMWAGGSRFVSETLAVFLHTNFYINDISPITQLFSIAVICVTAYLIAGIIGKGKVTRLSLAAASLFGMTPFFLENMSYKYDCPYMALSVLFAVIPFLCTSHYLAYCITSFTGLILVCSSYQASNSVYILLAIYCAFALWLDGASWKKIGIFAGLSVASYVAALVYFRAVIMIPWSSEGMDVGTDIVQGNLIAGIARNFITYVHVILRTFGNIWIKGFTALAMLIFPCAIACHAKNKKLVSGLFALVIMSGMFALSYGAYLILEDAAMVGRAFIGFAVFVSLIATADIVFVQEARPAVLTKVTYGIVLCLFYGMGICTTVTGNLYAKQKDYQTFRFTILAQDLSHIVDPSQNNTLFVGGAIGQTSKAHMEYVNYHLEMGGATSPWSSYILANLNMNVEFSSTDTWENLSTQEKEHLQSLPLIMDSYYHTIYGKDNEYYVAFKNPQVTDYENGN